MAKALDSLSKIDLEYELFVEERLDPFQKLMAVSAGNYVGEFGLDAYMASYVYLTAKRLFVSPEYNMNREGWHSDGFMTDDINYIWSDCVPTVFNTSTFSLTQDDKVSLEEMEKQADDRFDHVFDNNTLLRLNQYVIHKCGEITKGTMRTFVKLSFSQDKYDLEGNSVNYMMDYDWKYKLRPRNVDRNIPQKV